jgi:trehalose-phosphatase
MKGFVTGHDSSRAGKATRKKGALAPAGPAHPQKPHPTKSQLLKSFFQTFTPQTTPILLLDYDGTLAPFRKDRFRAYPYAGVREILAAIQKTNTRIAVISGRPATEVVPLLGLQNIEVWGLHGAEHLFPDGHRELAELPEATLQNLARLRTYFHKDSFGGLFEDKPNAAVMHWRGASPQKAATIREKTLSLFESLAIPPAGPGNLTLLEFESGIELRAGPDKGSAVAAILKESDPESPVAFLGDDLTDEHAFRAINSRAKNGISILIRKEKRETEATLWLRPPTELKAFLKSWQTHATG